MSASAPSTVSYTHLFREFIFEVNGTRRTVKILDKAAKSVATVASTVMADEGNPNEVGANIPGTLIKLLVKEGDEVKENEPIAVLEAMKMETNVLATACLLYTST